MKNLTDIQSTVRGCTLEINEAWQRMKRATEGNDFDGAMNAADDITTYRRIRKEAMAGLTADERFDIEEAAMEGVR